MTGYAMNLTDEAVKKVFDDETYKIIEENKLLKLENAQLKEEQAIQNIKNEIVNCWALRYYIKNAKTLVASDFVTNTNDKDVYKTYVNLIKCYRYDLVDSVIEQMLKEAQEEENEDN